MTLDTQESILTAIYNILTADSTLQTAMGGSVSLYPVWAKPDAEFPYLVQRLDMRAGEIFAARIGTYLLDIWSYSTNASEIVAIRKRIVELLDERTFNTTEVKNVIVKLETDGFIPETEPDIYHYATQWNLSFWRQREAVYIISR
uniref:Tail protein n=1 Tax=viral metagenome TaxID=1070528 RepID=A0A6M3INT2_9ZZZZ